MRFSHLLAAALVAAVTATPAFAQDIKVDGKLDLDFADADANGDGALALDEIAAILPPGVGKSMAGQMLKMMDADGDLQVTPAELTELARQGSHHAVIMPDLAVLAPFAEVDADRDGRITLTELDQRGEEPIAGFHALYVSGADKDRDGGVSRAEWDAARPTVTASVGPN